MGTNYDDECSPSILVRYSSDNDSEDLVYPADPRLVQAHLEAQGQPPPPPPPPASPVTGVSTTSTSPFPDLWGLERSLTPSPTMDSPGEPAQQLVAPPERPEVCENIEETQEVTQTTLCTSSNDICTQPTLEVNVSETVEVPKPNEKMTLLGMKEDMCEEDDDFDPGCCGCFMPVIRTVMGVTRMTISNIRHNVMEWIQAHSARPSSSRQQDNRSVAEQERQQAEDFIRNNSHRSLDELLTENKAAQIDKVKEYNEKRKKKAPCLSDQRFGPDGRIIFSKEYVDFMLYRDLQPLVDIRVLRIIEEIIVAKIRERDQQQVVEQLEDTKLTGKKNSKTSDTRTPKKKSAVQNILRWIQSQLRKLRAKF